MGNKIEYTAKEKQAIRKCIKMWTWLAEHPGEWKDEYFITYPRLRIPICKCYLCDSSLYKSKCTRCPLNIKGRSADCTEYYHPYSKWGDNNFSSEYAWQIVELCKKALGEDVIA